ncbi:MAG: hypothetical protein SFX74_02815 [Fimbriimonadaceae bacterium]|nr:hypothetical protein [Fimbriimonadaceae bacterium]
MPPAAISRRARGQRERGQTIIVAMIILGVLLILGLVFLGIINNSIQNTSRRQTRTVTSDLAEAGIRFAHDQLLHSAEGADWRGNPTPPVPTPGTPNFTRDPDAIYTRLASGFALASGQIDRGGPDGLGPFVRVNFDNGRALIRVRYAPSDANIFSANPAGSLRNPGAVRNYLIIESVGRPGTVVANDPTFVSEGEAVQFRNFASAAQFQQALGQFRQRLQSANNRILTAFVSLGITETARFFTNKNKVSRPVELGVPRDLGATYVNPQTGATIQIGDTLRAQLGLPAIEESVGASRLFNVGGLGSLHSNADLTFYGQVDLYENPTLGDQVTVAGNITGSENAVVRVARREFNATTGTWDPQTVTTLNAGSELDSRSANFTTVGGVLRDGVPSADTLGYSRGVGYKVPPSIGVVDPDSNENRYVQMTRDSGLDVGNGNSGRFGHGSGVYIDNVADKQSSRSEAARQATGGTQSMVFDWLNPNHPESKYWSGPFYLPPGTTVELRHDGFLMARDGRAPADQRFWRTPTGASTSSSVIRYRLGPGTDGRLHLVNSYTPGITNIDGTLSAVDYQLGPAFNGVIHAEGNLRVRGVIPTDIQVSLVSGGTIYIEGSIVKGTIGNAWTARTPSDPEFANAGARINRPSRSMLALLARDYVAVNTTMLVGPSPLQALEPSSDANAVRVRQDAAGIGMLAEFTLGAVTATDLYNPSNWQPLAATYRDAISNTPINTRLILSHSMEDGAADRSLMSLSVNPGLIDTGALPAESTYFWPNDATNAASPILNVPAPTIPVYGLGVENWQRYPKYETRGFVLVNPSAVTLTGTLLTSTGVTGQYALNGQGTNALVLRPNQVNNVSANDGMLRKVAITPHDVRIEALIYAEDGAFFVIPGTWFNSDAGDRRDIYQARLTELVNGGQPLLQARAIADDERMTAFGSSPEAPFYGEPLDVRISISGAVAENMPPSMSEQAEWMRKWGWIPGQLGATGSNIPASHARGNPAFNTADQNFAPNLIISYDPVLASGRSDGFANLNSEARILRTDAVGRVLPPLPRLPVSPALAYFGDVN